MDEEAVLTADIDGELADGFDERQAFDVADGAADFDDRHVVASLAAFDPVLDFVGDMGDDLDGAALVITFAFFLDHGPVDLAGGDAGVLGETLVDESFVMAQVEVGFGAVVGDENFAMLERVHGAWIDIEVGVEFLHRDLDATCFEQASERCSRDALAQA